MPNQTTPPRRLKTMIERIRDDAKKEGVSGGAQKVTVERVEQTLPNNRIVAAGSNLPITGNGAGVQTGQRIPVAWKDGKPTAAIFHHAQSAQFIPVTGEKGSIVEELFISNSTETPPRPTIWFRNYKQVTELKYTTGDTPITNDWGGGAPLEVFWGVNTDTFAVRVGDGAGQIWHVYRLNRTPNKIYPSGKAAKVTEKLYSIGLKSDVTISAITFTFTRDSSRPVVIFNSVLVSPPPFNLSVGSVDRQPDTASLNRVITLKLNALTPIYDQSLADIRKGDVVPSLVPGAVLNENNQIVYNVKLRFVDFGCCTQGPSGLTGTHTRLDNGDFDPNQGTFSCPFRIIGGSDVSDPPFLYLATPIITPFSTLSPTTGATAPTLPTPAWNSATSPFHIDETHTVSINANTGAVVARTLRPTVTLIAEESRDGLLHPREWGSDGLGNRVEANLAITTAVHQSNFPVVTDRCSFHLISIVTPTADIGNLGRLGIVKSEGSLFDPAQPYDNPTQRKTDTTQNVTAQVGFTELFVIGAGSIATSFSYDLKNVVERYRVEVTITPFFSKSGNLYQFVGALRRALKPTGFSSDQHFVGAFVLVGNTVHTASPFTITTDPTTIPTLMMGNSHRVLWRLGADAFMFDYIHNLSKKVGANATTLTGTLTLTEPDFLYAFEELKRYFVNGWKRVSPFDITLDQAAAGFPPRDSVISTGKNGPIGQLAKVPSSQASPSNKDYQTVLDTTVVPGQYRT